MGNTDSKAGFRKAIQDLKNKDKIIEPDNDAFWRQFWGAEQMNFQLTAADVFSLVTAEDIRGLREDVPQNLATLAFKAIDHLRVATEGAAPCTTPAQQQTVLNCVRLLTRLVPFFLEEPEWRSFFWSALPSVSAASSSTRQGPLSRFPSYPAGGSLDYPEPPTPPSSAGARFRLFDGPVLATTLINSLSTLLFCPGFTVNQHKKASEQTEDLTSLDCVEYIWAAGVGFAVSPPQNANYDAARIEILRLLLACFSESMYGTSASEGLACPNRWLEYFTSAENRPVLPLFTSLLNVVFSYDPVGYGVPYNYLMFGDSKEPLAEVALQVLIVCLDHVCRVKVTEAITKEQLAMESDPDSDMLKNMFINYLSRIHRDEDLAFMTDGMVRLLNNPLQVGYLPSSTKKIHFQAELLILFWKCCEYNRKFLYHVLKSCVVLDILIPILHTLHQNRLNPSKIGLIHLNVFILLLLSGERNFGVRLNKPFTGRALPDLPAFTGNYADLIILVFHRMVTSGQSKLQPLFDCLLTIIQNISPYVKSLASVTATKLLHLFEAFSTPWFLYANPSNHNLVFYLMDTFNNLIQYQFDGNAPLVYCIIRKRALFHQLANLPMDPAFIEKTVRNRKGSRRTSVGSAIETESETSEETRRLEEAGGEEKEKPGLHTTLPQIPGVGKMTGRASGQNLEGFMDESPSVLRGKERPSMSGAYEAGTSGILEESTSESSGDVVFEASNVGTTRIPVVSRSNANLSFNLNTVPVNPAPGPHGALGEIRTEKAGVETGREALSRSVSVASTTRSGGWTPTPEWVRSWKHKLPMATVLRLLQVLVPQVEKFCMDKNITEETEIVKFLQNGTLVGLLPVPHPLLIRRYQANAGTSTWVRTYLWGVLYLRNTNPAIWFDTKVTLFEIQSG